MNKSYDLLTKSSDRDFLKYLRRTLPAGYIGGGGGGGSLPTGGTTGQVLSKDSNLDGDASWQTIPVPPSGGTTGQVLKKASNSNYDYVWAADESTIYVATYADLPDPTTVSGKTYGVLTSTGVPYISVLFGGSFRAKGFYYSNGTTWIYVGEFPMQATQAEVDAGTVTDKFVTPATLSIWNSGRKYPLSTDTINISTFYSDFLSASPWDSFWVNINSSGTSVVAAGNPPYRGVVVVGTGTASSTGRNHTYSNSASLRTNSSGYIKTKASLNWLTSTNAPDGTNTHETVFGFINSVTATPSRGAFFVAECTLVSNSFKAVTIDGGVPEETILTMPSNSTYQLFEVILVADNTAIFYIDNVEVARHTTVLPNANSFGTGFGVRKTGNGLATRQIGCDWIAFEQKFT